MCLSVVIATFNRGPLLARLLRQLSVQTLESSRFEVVVVDDGSELPAAEALAAFEPPFSLRIVRQPNQGAAAARDHGAKVAEGDLIVFIDDDMQVGADFLESHLNTQRAAGGGAVVLGRICADPHLSRMPLFERWHQALLDRMAQKFASGALVPRGSNLFSGNVCLPRAAYLEVGGFDRTLGLSEDVELGLRLEAAGHRFVFANAAITHHGSDHTSLEKWRARAMRYGRFDLRIARKHPSAKHAHPWRFLFELNLVARPFAALGLLLPGVARILSRGVLFASHAADRMGLEAPAHAGTTVVYMMDYFRGTRQELRGWSELSEGLRRYREAA